MILEVLKKLNTPPLPNIINISVLITILAFKFWFRYQFFFVHHLTEKFLVDFQIL